MAAFAAKNNNYLAGDLMVKTVGTASFLIALIASVLFAGPKIDFDTKIFNCGVVYEGKTETLSAVFTVKNTGNALLKIESVRPGCGCTVVKYDSLVQPGKTVKIESQVNIKGYKAGDISKSITVTSNAENEPTSRLTITASIRAFISISDTYINLEPANAKVPASLSLTSRKKDLKVSAVIFKANTSPDVPEWQSGIPLTVKYTWSATDSIRAADSTYSFKLEIFSPAVEKSVSGEIVIKTNHPDKPEIPLSGSINK